jgi:hypothetical protein
MADDLRINDRVRVRDSKSAVLFPGRWSRFPATGDMGTVIDFDGGKPVIENIDAHGTTWWIATFNAADLDLVQRPAAG